jgi:hypothetical protein
MTPFLDYMVKVGAALILFYGFYELFLKKETYFHLNRIYLVSALFLSFLLPAVPLASPFRTLPAPGDFAMPSGGPLPVRIVDSADLLPIIYAAGAFLLFVRLGTHFLRLGRVIRRNGVRRDGPVRIVAVERDFSPFSFFGLVFINLRDPRLSESDLRRILAHEQVHVRQGHSFDVLLMELVIILQWFNPFVWPYKKALRETHEYLADFGVLAQGFNSAKYRRLVFEQHVGAALFEFGNNFKQSQIKRRITMMSKSQSGKASRLKLLLALPLVLVLVLAFAEPRAAVSAAPAGQVDSASKAKVEQTFADIKKLEQVLKDLTQKIETATDETLKKEWTSARTKTEKKLQMLQTYLMDAGAARRSAETETGVELKMLREKVAVLQTEMEKIEEPAARLELKKKLQMKREEREHVLAARERSDLREESAVFKTTVEAKEFKEKEAGARVLMEKSRIDEERIEYNKKMLAEIKERQASRAAQADKAITEYKRLLENSQDAEVREESRKALTEILERREQMKAELSRSKTRDTTEVSEATARLKALREKESVFEEQADKNRDAAIKDEYLKMLKADQERRDQMLFKIQERQTSRAARADEAATEYKRLLEKEEIGRAEVLDEFRKARESDADVTVGITAAGLKKIIAELTDEELAVRSKIARTEDEKLRLELKAQLAGILNKIEAAKAEYLKLKSEKV